jgi:hypothetical protein
LKAAKSFGSRGPFKKAAAAAAVVGFEKVKGVFRVGSSFGTFSRVVTELVRMVGQEWLSFFRLWVIGCH